MLKIKVQELDLQDVVPPCIFISWAHDMSSQPGRVGMVQHIPPRNMELKNEVVNGG